MEPGQFGAKTGVVEGPNVDVRIDDPHGRLARFARWSEPVGEASSTDERRQPFADLVTKDGPILSQIQGLIDSLGLRGGFQESLDAVELPLIHVKVLTTAPG